jgi:Protein of unknown function (DUF1375)
MITTRRAFKLLFSLTATLVACCGCTSFLIHSERENSHDEFARFYPGTTIDACLIAHPNVINRDMYFPPALTLTYGLLDFAPSFAYDTLLLPADFILYNTNTPAVSPSKK